MTVNKDTREAVEPTTICYNCIHFFNNEPNSPRQDVWYNHLCRASPRQPIADPVTGKSGYKGVNDLGGEYITDEPYDYCRKLNKGLCLLYEPK